ncbi:hypothetical protein JCM15519_23300 [Fundidesulfovibrio butyratiphilus]
MKRFVVLVLQQCLLVALLLAALEVVLRTQDIIPVDYVYARYYTDLIGDFDPSSSILSQHPQEYPYRFTTNSQGLRSLHEISKEKPDGVIRILCLGDSFTLGWGVQDDQTYPERLYQILKAKYPGKRFEVINTGLMFSNVLDQLSYYNDKGRFLNADVVLSQYCYNDVSSDMFRPFVGRQAMSLETGRPYDSGILGIVRRALSRSAIVKAAAYVSAKYAGKDGFSKKFLPKPNTYPKRDGINALLLSPTEEEHRVLNTWFAFTDESTIPQLQRAWGNFTQAATLLKGQVERDGAAFIFFSVPSQNEIDTYRNAERCVFSAWARQESVHYVDMTPIFRDNVVKSTAELLLPRDGHPSPKGNVVIAQALADAITVGDTLAIHTPDPAFACGEQASLRLDRNDKGDLVFVQDASRPRLKATVETKGLVAHGEPGSAVTIVEPVASAGQGRTGVMDILFTSDIPASSVALVCTRRVFNDGASRIALLDGDSGKTYWVYDAENDQHWDGMENTKIMEWSAREGVTRLHLRFAFTGKAQLVFNVKPTNREREFAFHCFFPSPETTSPKKP